MTKKYQPIDCSFYDLLLEFATKREQVKLTYFIEDKTQNISQVLIKDVFTKKGEEFLELATGQIIRLDQIISINEHPLPGDSSCKIPPENSI